MTFFVDSNFFLQYKKHDQLKWSEITSDKEIIILITRPVQIEIDRLKNDGNSRRSKRARDTSSFFREILASDNFSLIVKTSNNDIKFEFAKQYKDDILANSNPSLDITNTDDKILAIMNMYQIENIYDNNLCFLSNDINPLLTAKINELPTKQIPDSWLLEPENDERDKKISKLEKQLLELQKKEPLIDIIFNLNDYDSSVEKTNNLEINIKMYNQIETSNVKELVNLFINKHPQKTNFEINEDELPNRITRMTFGMHTYIPPSEDKINEYKKMYQNWGNDLFDLISNYASKQNELSCIVPFKVTISNNGNIPAENFLLDFEVITGGKLVSPNFDEEVLMERLAYPTPPKSPQGEWKDSTISALEKYSIKQANMMKSLTQSFGHRIIPSFTIPTPQTHDKNLFYWKENKPEKNSILWKFECNEFRHKLDNEDFSYYLTFDDNCDKLVFQITASASNMSEPIKKIFIINKKYIVYETKNDIINLIKNGVTEDVMKRIEGSKKDE